MKVSKATIIRRAKEILAATIERCPQYATKLQGIRFEANARMTSCAGKAQYRTNTVKLSMAFFEDEDNFNSAFFNTVTHEMAHLVVGIEGRNGRPHGPFWQLVHRSMGGDGKRCHALELAEGHTKRRSRGRAARTEVPCWKCGKPMLLGPVQYKKFRFRGAMYSHRKCPV